MGIKNIGTYSERRIGHIMAIEIVRSHQSFQVEGPQKREISLFLRNKIGRFLRGLFKVLPKTIGLRNDLRTVVLRRCLFFILAFTSQSDVVNPAMTNMICHFYASRCPLVLN